MQQFLEAVFRQQADVFGEHGEEAALEESGDDTGVVLVGFEGFGEFGEAAGDVAGDFGGFLGGIERVGIGPDGAEARAGFSWRRSVRRMRWFFGSGKRS